jgi:radical SAM superfamily enzyme YgiQ (UPF0313 family)
MNVPTATPASAGRIVLTTLNARYSHASLGLRYLYANLGELRAQAVIREFTINDQPATIAEALLIDEPRIIGFGIYIWNLRETAQVIAIIRRVAPAVRLVIGGPEVSHEYDALPLLAAIDVLITGEADLTFPAVCRALLAGESVNKIVRSEKPDLTALTLPYQYYNEDDLAHRLIYVEASRGCPFTCEFCLSSVDNGVRAFPLEQFLTAMEALIARGCRTFKFVDRTFNLSPRTATAILTFFLAHWRDGMFLHFELVPDRLPDAIKELIVRFPPGAVQFEIGIQSFTPEVGALISRRMDTDKTIANLTWLRVSGGVHIHADLIIGLPGETMATLADSFDKLWWLAPHEIQVGILKLLKGTPIARRREAFALEFNPEPPYDILSSRDFPFPLMQRLKRFARYFEIYANSGKFRRALELLVTAGAGRSPFAAILAFSDWLWQATGQDHGLGQKRQYELIHRFLMAAGSRENEVIEALRADFLAHGGSKYLPEFLRPAVESARRAALT